MSENTPKGNGISAQDVTNVNSTEYQSGNAELKAKYNEMHTKGKSAWFDDGYLERNLILEMGQPWTDLAVLEIGCGEGDLCAMMKLEGANPLGIDYSEKAIGTANARHPGMQFLASEYRDVTGEDIDRIVMQGVLEHLDDPFTELKWMIDHFTPETVITSSPAFLNTRGIVWHTLDMLGAVMSLTDLHYLNPWEFNEFCLENGYRIDSKSTDYEWANKIKMSQDLTKRIPLALRDGNIPYDPDKLERFIEWLFKCGLTMPDNPIGGAVICYRIDI